MNVPLKVAAVTVLAVVIGAGVLVELRPASDVGSSPSASPTPVPAPLRDGPLPAGTYVTAPFARPGSDACHTLLETGCIDPTDDDAIRVTFTVPEGWEGSGSDGVTYSSATERAALIFVRGASLAADPCRSDGTNERLVGPSVANFESALRGHPLLSVTDAIDTTIGGHPGKYMELQVPDDPTIQGDPQASDLEGCPVYRPWNPWYLAQGPGELWHLWIVDVDGVRVVVQAIDHATTSAGVKAQLQEIVDSVRIERPVAAAASSAPASLAWSPASLGQDWPAPVRGEPAGDPVTVRFQGGGEDRRYTDPVGDIGTAPTWLDIVSVGAGSIGLAGPMPSPVPDPAEAWIAYGVVLDTDGDGVADLRLGVDNLPASAGHRAWMQDLETGRTDMTVGPPYGYVGDRYFDTFYPEAGADRVEYYGGFVSSRFYAWASLIEDGRVVATDYAPDSGWLETNS